MEARFFGRPQRVLFGAMHAAASPGRGRLLICAPLLQEGIRSRRALWALAEGMATAGVDALRFDWYGSGDSDGVSEAMSFDGLHEDLRMAVAALPLLSRGGGRLRRLALRCAALPLLSETVRQGVPADLVLWDPVLDGKGLLARWRRQHRQQLRWAGRYLSSEVSSDADELLGFPLGVSLTGPLALFDARLAPLPAGSRLLLAVWKTTDELEAFATLQRQAGVQVEIVLLEAFDAPPWEDPEQFEAQAFPRRSVNQLVKRLAAEEWS